MSQNDELIAIKPTHSILSSISRMTSLFERGQRGLKTCSREIGHEGCCFLSMEIHAIRSGHIRMRTSVTKLLDDRKIMTCQLFDSVVEPFVGRCHRLLREMVERAVIGTFEWKVGRRGERMFEHSSRMKNFHRAQLRMMNILPMGGIRLRDLLIIERSEGFVKKSISR